MNKPSIYDLTFKQLSAWLLERGLSPKFARLGVGKPGHGGLSEHMFHQGIDPDSILAKIKELAG